MTSKINEDSLKKDQNALDLANDEDLLFRKCAISPEYRISMKVETDCLVSGEFGIQRAHNKVVTIVFAEVA